MWVGLGGEGFLHSTCTAGEVAVQKQKKLAQIAQIAQIFFFKFFLSNYLYFEQLI